MRDGFVFYSSFYDAISDLGLQQQAKIYNAICRYALLGEEPNLSGALSTVFKLIKPQIDANNKRYENGKKGGRPVKSTISEDEKPNHNQTETKGKPNLTKHKPKEKEKEKDKEKEKEKDARARARADALPSDGVDFFADVDPDEELDFFAGIS